MSQLHSFARSSFEGIDRRKTCLTRFHGQFLLYSASLPPRHSYQGRPNPLHSTCQGGRRHSNHFSRLAPTIVWPVDRNRLLGPLTFFVLADWCSLRLPLV